MGQGYRATPAEFIDDAMFKMPAELTGKLIERKDKEIDDTITNMLSYKDKLTADVLQEDTPQARKKIEEYGNKIDEVIQNILKDPINYGRHTGTIQSLSRDITTDWAPDGEVGTMQATKQSYLTEDKRIDEEVKAGRLEPNMAEIEKKRIRAEYIAQGGQKWNKESRTPENGISLQDQYYKVEFDEKFLAQMKPESYSQEWDEERGLYIFTHKNTGKSLTKSDIIATYMTQLNADTQNKYASQRYAELSEIGGLGGYEGINDISTAFYTEEKKDKKGNPIITYHANPNSYWGRKAQAAADTFEQKESSSSITRKDHTMNQHAAKIKMETEVDEVIVSTEVVLGSKNNTSTSALNTYTANTKQAQALDAELSSIADVNGYKQGSAGYKAIVSGDFTAIKTLFVDQVKAESLISKIKETRLNKNLLKASIDYVDSNLPYTVDTWTPEQKKIYDTKMAEYQKTKTVVSGNASFAETDITPKSKKEFQGVFKGKVMEGNTPFVMSQSIPSIKYNGAGVRYLDSDNAAFREELDPKKAVQITHQGKVYYTSTPAKDNIYLIGARMEKGKMVGGQKIQIKPENILITKGIPGGEVNMNLLVTEGHLQKSEVKQNVRQVANPETGFMEDVNDGTPAMVYQTVSGGKPISIDMDESTIAPSYLQNNRKENYSVGAFKVGGKAIDIQVKGKNISTQTINKAWEMTAEERSIATSIAKFGGKANLTAIDPSSGVEYILEGDKYYMKTDTQYQEIKDRDVILDMQKVLFYQ